jgi:hypothetical protein
MSDNVLIAMTIESSASLAAFVCLLLIYRCFLLIDGRFAFFELSLDVIENDLSEMASLKGRLK